MKRLEELWEAWCRRKGLAWALLLWPLSLLYGACSRLLRLGRPTAVEGLDVVSVGNLSVGGSGKTPLVQFIAGQALRRRLKPAVLMRGGQGDEARLYHGMLVYEGPDRLASAREARAMGRNLALLDDGFQRRHQLARRLDILVLDWSRRAAEGHCLPAGRLREPLAAGREAQAVVVTHAPAGLDREALKAGLPAPLKGLKIFSGEHRPLLLRSVGGHLEKPLSWLRGRRVTALSGIGNPAAFEAVLARLGAQYAPLRYPDHHAYSAGDLRLLEGTEFLVCTAKDAVKMRGLASPPVWVLEMEMRVSPEKEFLRMLFP